MPYKNIDDKRKQNQRWKKANKDKVNQAHRKYREENKDLFNARGREYYSNNLEKFQLKKQRQTKDRLEWLLENVGDHCVQCGSTENLEFDHINPALKTNRCSFRALGIQTLEEQKDNIQTLCHECHKEKSNAQRKASWELFISLPLDEQERLIELQRKREG